MPDFHGTITDLGGPSANMYRMTGKNVEICKKCKRASCAFPTVCSNMNTDHADLMQVYRKAAKIPGVKHCFIGSGIRYDLVMHRTDNPEINENNRAYLETVIRKHVSGRLKVAPEHVSDKVLKIIRKQPFSLFKELNREFERINKKYGLKQQLIPYFISSHPGCGIEDMAELAIETKSINFHLEQVQDFTPTPMTLSTTIYATGYHPYSMEKIRTARTEKEKREQNSMFFWYKPEYRDRIKATLSHIGRKDLIEKLFANENNKEKTIKHWHRGK